MVIRVLFAHDQRVIGRVESPGIAVIPLRDDTDNRQISDANRQSGGLTSRAIALLAGCKSDIFGRPEGGVIRQSERQERQIVYVSFVSSTVYLWTTKAETRIQLL